MPASFADATAEQVREFNQSQGRLRIKVARGPVDTDAMADLAISSLLLGDTPYDAMLVDISQLTKFVAADWLEPLEGWFSSDSFEAMVPGARLGNAFDGHIWRLPFTADIGLLYWRTDLMEQPPQTPQELEAISRDLQRQGTVRWGYIWQGRQYEGLSCVVLETLDAFGARWWQPSIPAAAADSTSGGAPAMWESGSTELDSPAAVRAAAWLDRLVTTGITPEAVANYAEAEALGTFAAGDAALMRNWPYAWRELERMGSEVVGKVGVTTVVGRPGQQGSGTLGSWGLSMLTGVPHPNETAEVIRWFSGPEFQRRMAVSAGYPPTWKALYEDEELKRQVPMLAVERQALENPVERPPTPLYAQLSDVVQRQVNGMLTRHGDPGMSMARAQRQSELVLRAAAGTPTEAP